MDLFNLGVEVEIPDWMGEILSSEDDLLKGAGHKYIRRIPTGNPKKPWKYFYKVSGGEGLGHHSEFVEGAAFKVAHNGKEGHFHILGVEGDKLKIKHDESGEESTLTKDALTSLLHKEHAQAIGAHKERLKKELVAVSKHGSEKQKAKIQKEAEKAGVLSERKPVVVKYGDPSRSVKATEILSDYGPLLSDDLQVELFGQKVTRNDHFSKDAEDLILPLMDQFKAIRERRRDLWSLLDNVQKMQYKGKFGTLDQPNLEAMDAAEAMVRKQNKIRDLFAAVSPKVADGFAFAERTPLDNITDEDIQEAERIVAEATSKKSPTTTKPKVSVKEGNIYADVTDAQMRYIEGLAKQAGYRFVSDARKAFSGKNPVGTLKRGAASDLIEFLKNKVG